MTDSNKDLEDLARTTTEDYYDLLGVPFDAEESAVKRAYRKASIRFHPDKNPDNKDAADKFIALGWARDILIDAKLKAEYDRARTRRRQKAIQDDLLTGSRRKMVQDLERRERESAGFRASLKRKGAPDMSEEGKREREIQRLAEDGRRRLNEMRERREKARKEEEAAAAKPVKSPEPQRPKPGESEIIDRTIKIRFHRNDETAAWDKDTMQTMFNKYGKIDSIVIAGADKKLKLEGEKHRKAVGTAYIVYRQLDYAHAAVSDAKTDFPALDSVVWVDHAPDLTSLATAHANGISSEEFAMMRLKDAAKKSKEQPTSTHEAASASKDAAKKPKEQPTSTHEAASASPTTFSTPPPKPFRPSTSSLGSTPLSTPKFSFANRTPASSKMAERKKLEADIRDREAAEEAAEAKDAAAKSAV